MSTQQMQVNEATSACEKEKNVPDLLGQLDELTSSIVKDGEQEQSQASGDSAQDQGDNSLEDMLRSLHKQLKSSAMNNLTMEMLTQQKLTLDATNSSEIGQDIPDLLEQLDQLASSAADDKGKEQQEQSQASGDSAQSQGSQASGDSAQGQGKESLEDMLRSLHKQIKTSDWLHKNTTEKWATENPQLAKDYMEAMKKS